MTTIQSYKMAAAHALTAIVFLMLIICASTKVSQQHMCSCSSQEKEALNTSENNDDIYIHSMMDSVGSIMSSGDQYSSSHDYQGNGEIIVKLVNMGKACEHFTDTIPAINRKYPDLIPNPRDVCQTDSVDGIFKLKQLMCWKHKAKIINIDSKPSTYKKAVPDCPYTASTIQPMQFRICHDDISVSFSVVAKTREETTAIFEAVVLKILFYRIDKTELAYLSDADIQVSTEIHSCM